MIKIVIITPEWNEASHLKKEQHNEIHEWFALNCFDIPFVPQIGMQIDLDSFCDCEEILNEVDGIIGYVTIDKIVIGKNDIALHCI